MSSINPISNLYTDMVNILKSLSIKYSGIADAGDTMEIRFKFESYCKAYLNLDKFETYDDYNIYEYANTLGYTIKDNKYYDGIDDNIQTSNFIVTSKEMNDILIDYRNDPTKLTDAHKGKLLIQRREREINNYVEENNYYRCLNGLPNIEDTEVELVNLKNPKFLYVPDNYCEEYSISKFVPIHEIEYKYGEYYISLLEGLGVVSQMVQDNPDKEYLKYIGSHRIPVYEARKAKNFSILYVDKTTVRDSTMKQFLQIYESCRNYFISTAYIYEYRQVLDYYDNFIALCIFVMTVQQLSIRAISNAVDREFYDEYSVQLLYETYGVPYNGKIDQTTQQQIIQNLNLLVQNKATDKVLIDIASLLGFSNAEIYNYYLVKERSFDTNGRPIVKTRENFNSATGRYETGYDYEAMYDIHFQKVKLGETNIFQSITDPRNRVSYDDVTFYDPFWWEDDTELYKEVWETEYNTIETKYLGMTLPYRLTEMIFQSVILLQIILDKYKEIWDLMVELPKICDGKISLVDTVILLCALFSKKYNITGEITQLPSKVINVLEVLDQDINKEYEYGEVLRFDFIDFDPSNPDDPVTKLQKYLIERKYMDLAAVKELRKEAFTDEDKHHDVDPNHTFNPFKLVKYTESDEEWQKLCGYLRILFIDSTATKNDKITAINEIYTNVKQLYQMISYRMGTTNNYREYYALKKFYDTIFYSRNSYDVFKVKDKTTNKEIMPKTFLEYLKYKNIQLYNFVNNVDEDLIYSYIDHIIYKIEDIINDLGYLYIKNDGYSPLEDLLRQLIIFFKSYTTDVVNISSVLIVDTRLDNILRFIDHPSSISKKIAMKDMISGMGYADFMKLFKVSFNIKDIITFNDIPAIQSRVLLGKDIDENLRLSDDSKVNKTIELKEDIVRLCDEYGGMKAYIHDDDTIKFTDSAMVRYID